MEKIAATRARTYQTSRKARKVTGKSKYNFKEKLVLQCIMCGVILALLMLTSIINSDFSSLITNRLGTQISENTDFTGILPAVKTALGYETDAEVKDAPSTDEGNAEVNSEAPPEIRTDISTESEINAVDVIRVDEDILNELNNAEDIYNQKN